MFLNSIEPGFHLLQTKPMAGRHAIEQQLKAAELKAWKSGSGEETRHLVTAKWKGKWRGCVKKDLHS